MESLIKFHGSSHRQPFILFPPKILYYVHLPVVIDLHRLLGSQHFWVMQKSPIMESHIKNPWFQPPSIIYIDIILILDYGNSTRKTIYFRGTVYGYVMQKSPMWKVVSMVSVKRLVFSSPSKLAIV